MLWGSTFKKSVECSLLRISSLIREWQLRLGRCKECAYDLGPWMSETNVKPGGWIFGMAGTQPCEAGAGNAQKNLPWLAPWGQCECDWTCQSIRHTFEYFWYMFCWVLFLLVHITVGSWLGATLTQRRPPQKYRRYLGHAPAGSSAAPLWPWVDRRGRHGRNGLSA